MAEAGKTAAATVPAPDAALVAPTEAAPTEAAPTEASPTEAAPSEASAAPKEAAPALPSGWTAIESSTTPGSVYFFNELSRASRWERPTAEAVPSKVRVRHVLVKFAGSRNPVSRRTNEKISLSGEAAVEQLRDVQKQLAADPKAFDKIAEARSDCSSFKRGGDLGSFERGAMQKPFEDASFALAIGETSGIIQSDSGFHLIKRTN